MLYSRSQLKLLTALAATCLVGLGVREWRAGFPDLADRLERFDLEEASTPPTGRPGGSPGAARAAPAEGSSEAGAPTGSSDPAPETPTGTSPGRSASSDGSARLPPDTGRSDARAALPTGEPASSQGDARGRRESRAAPRGGPPRPDGGVEMPRDSKRAESAIADPRPLDINRASAAELARLPGVGPALADRILAERQRRGRFESTEALRYVLGMGPKKLAAIRALVWVSDQPPGAPPAEPPATPAAPSTLPATSGAQPGESAD